MDLHLSSTHMNATVQVLLPAVPSTCRSACQRHPARHVCNLAWLPYTQFLHVFLSAGLTASSYPPSQPSLFYLPSTYSAPFCSVPLVFLDLLTQQNLVSR